MVPATANGRSAGLSASTRGEFSAASCSSRSLAQAPAHAKRRKMGAASARTVHGTLLIIVPILLEEHGVHKEEAGTLIDVQVVLGAGRSDLEEEQKNRTRGRKPRHGDEHRIAEPV